MHKVVIHTTQFSTPLGPMIASATDKGICLLEFTDRVKLENEFDELTELLNGGLRPGMNAHLAQLQHELEEYFAGTRRQFSVALHIPGNPFSQSVWQMLLNIPYGSTWSYKYQAEMMNNPKAIRAIAAANGRNRLAILVPCHRVIGSSGSLTGYAAGIEKKKWLLNFEKENSEAEPGYLF